VNLEPKASDSDSPPDQQMLLEEGIPRSAGSGIAGGAGGSHQPRAGSSSGRASLVGRLSITNVSHKEVFATVRITLISAQTESI
jgi:hypothetical protein